MSRKGENIYRRKDGRWEARYIHHYEEGKARYRYIYADSYAEAREKKQEAENQQTKIIRTSQGIQFVQGARAARRLQAAPEKPAEQKKPSVPPKLPFCPNPSLPKNLPITKSPLPASPAKPFKYQNDSAEQTAPALTTESADPIASMILTDLDMFDFSILSELWLDDIKVCVKESTFTRYYRIVMIYLIPAFKDKNLMSIDQRYLNRITEQLLEEGGRNKRPLAPKTVVDILSVLKMILRFANENNYPCSRISSIKYPQTPQRGVKVMAEDNRLRMEELLLSAGDTTSLGILFTLFTGVRIGELCGLMWGDIDFNCATVRICRTVERIADLNPDTPAKTKVIITQPKTASSERIIPLPTFLARYLYERRERDDCFLLTGSRRNTEPHQFYIRYQRYLRRNRIDQYTFHSLRHTFATRCVELGFDIKSLSEILGHTNVNTTLSVYVHPSLQQKKVQMERLKPSVQQYRAI